MSIINMLLPKSANFRYEATFEFQMETIINIPCVTQDVIKYHK